MNLVVKEEAASPSGNPLTLDNLRLLFPHLPDGHLDAQALAAVGYAPVLSAPPILNDDPTKALVSVYSEAKNEDGAWVQVWRTEPIQFDSDAEREAAENSLLDRERREVSASLANLRWLREVGGITLPNGTPVRTDRHTQTQITAAVVQVQAGVLSEVRWKLETGFATLSGPEITAIATAVTGHVAACFAAEETVAAQIAAAATVEDLRAIDIQAAFDAALTNAQ